MLDFESTRSPEYSVYASASVGAGVASASTGLNDWVGAPAAAGAALAQWLMQSLDHVGRGMLLVSQGGRVLHANRLARSALAGSSHALHVEQGRLCASQARDDKLLHEAIDAALHRGLRRMLTLGRSAAATAAGHGGGAITLAVLPIEDPTARLGCAAAQPGHSGMTASAALISLPQSNRSKDLAVQIFAREQGCTSAETAVLEALLAGLTPEAIAQAKKVALCTVRTQIGQLRLKTGSHTIRELLDRVAGLPPMMVVVQ